MDDSLIRLAIPAFFQGAFQQAFSWVFYLPRGRPAPAPAARAAAVARVSASLGWLLRIRKKGLPLPAPVR